MLAKFRDISIGICALTIALAIIILFPTIRRLLLNADSTITQVDGLVADSRPELKTILSQGKQFVFESRTAAKAFTEDLNSREAQRARLATQRAGESFAALAESMRAEWIPRGSLVLENGERTIGSANQLIGSLDRRLNADDGLLVELEETIKALRLPVAEVTPKIVALIESGRLAADEVRLLYAGDDMKKAVAELSRASTGFADTSREAARATKNFADGTERFPKLMDLLNKFATTTNRYAKALIFSRIIALLGGVLLN